MYEMSHEMSQRSIVLGVVVAVVSVLAGRSGTHPVMIRSANIEEERRQKRLLGIELHAVRKVRERSAQSVSAFQNEILLIVLLARRFQRARD